MPTVLIFLPLPSPFPKGRILEILKSFFRVKIPICALPILVHEFIVQRDLSRFVLSTISSKSVQVVAAFDQK